MSLSLTTTLPVDQLPKSLEVRKATRDLIDASISDNTRRAYEHALRHFREWIARERLDGASVTDAVIANYLVALHESGKAPATCGQIVAAIRFCAKLHEGIKAPIGPETERVLAGIRREGRARGRGAVKGVNFAEAEHAAATAEKGGTLKDLRDAAVLSVMSDGLLRISEARALTLDDVDFEDDETGRLTIRQSKTDQEGEGAVMFLGPPTVKRLRKWLEAAGIDNGFLFRRVYPGNARVGDGDSEMNVDSLREIIKQRCEAIGIDEGVSGHSLRIGGAQSLAAAGASLVEIQTAGRWISASMPGHYARGQLAAYGAVARIKYGLEGDELEDTPEGE